MNPTARISSLEKTVDALKLIIEKQNDTITALTLRVDTIENALKTDWWRDQNVEGEKQTKAPEYQPLFTQWPKGVGG